MGEEGMEQSGGIEGRGGGREWDTPGSFLHPPPDMKYWEKHWK